jgi:hypothetical protein
MGLSSAYSHGSYGLLTYSQFSVPPVPVHVTALSRTIVVGASDFDNTGPIFTKTPGEDIDYAFDWSQVIASDPIVTSAWSVSPGDAHIGSATATSTITNLFVSGGIAELVYVVTNTIVTASGLELEASFKLVVEEYNFASRC